MYFAKIKPWNIKVLLCSTLFFTSSILKAEEFSKMRYVMGTLLQIKVETGSLEEGERAIESGFKEVTDLDNLLSNYKSDSEISQINRQAYPEKLPVHKEIILLLQKTIPLMEKTNGAFDITIEPLTKIWALRERHLTALPLEEAVERARSKVNYKELEFSTSTNMFRFLKAGMGLDTGGVGKGYALDRALEKIKEVQIHSATLNFGGEILYWCKEPCARNFSIKHPLAPKDIWKKFKIEKISKPFAISTSANYEKYIHFVPPNEKEMKFSHILDPKTGWPVNNEIESVTVISGNASHADALSTAIFAMGLKKGKKFSESLQEEGVCILYRKNKSLKKLKSFQSKNWKKMCKKES